MKNVSKYAIKVCHLIFLRTHPRLIRRADVKLETLWLINKKKYQKWIELNVRAVVGFPKSMKVSLTPERARHFFRMKCWTFFFHRITKYIKKNIIASFPLFHSWNSYSIMNEKTVTRDIISFSWFFCVVVVIVVVAPYVWASGCHFRSSFFSFFPLLLYPLLFLISSLCNIMYHLNRRSRDEGVAEEGLVTPLRGEERREENEKS